MTASLTKTPGVCPRQPLFRSRLALRLLALLVWPCGGAAAGPGGDEPAGKDAHADLKPEPAWHPFSASIETAATFGYRNFNDYQLLPEIISLRYQRRPPEQFFHTPLTFSQEWALSVALVDFEHGLENHYFGLGLGPRLIFGLPNSRFSVYADGRFFVGWVDSTGMEGGQGQDMTFSAISSLGILYQVNPQLKIGAAFFYEHFSNGGFSEPEMENIGLDTVGPSLSLNYTF